MEYPKFRTGDRVVVLGSSREATVTAFNPNSAGNGYIYTYRFDGSEHEHVLPEFALASPSEVVYCVAVHEASDDGDHLSVDGAYRKRDDAVKRVGEIADQWLGDIGKYADRYEIGRDEDGFEAYPPGYYNNEHFTVELKACRIA